MAFGERLGGLGTLHTAAPPPHFPILAFHCWIGFQLNNTYIVHDCVNIKQQWSKSTDKYVLDYSEVLHLRQPICDQKNETPKKTQLRPPRTPPRLRHNHQPTITQNPTNQPPPRHRTPTHRRSRAPHARHSCEGRNPDARGEGPSPSLTALPTPHRTRAPKSVRPEPPPPSFPRRREGEFTFQVQHLVVKGLGRRAVAEALARGIVVQLDDLRKGRFGEVSQPGCAGQRAPQAADGVLHAPLLPGGSGIAEEGLDAQGMEVVVAGELSAVVEGDGLAPCRGEGGPAGGRWCRR